MLKTNDANRYFLNENKEKMYHKKKKVIQVDDSRYKDKNKRLLVL